MKSHHAQEGPRERREQLAVFRPLVVRDPQFPLIAASDIGSDEHPDEADSSDQNSDRSGAESEALCLTHSARIVRLS
jgi:hypothetical protein